MKKTYLFFTGLIASVSLNAQLIQANHAAVVGDSYAMYQCDSTAINAGSNGASAVWNFSAVVAHMGASQNYSALAVTNANYPNATVSVGSSNANTSYYNSDANSLKYYGGNITVGTIMATLVYTNAAIQAVYPMSLNTSTSNTIGGSINALSLPGTFTGSSSVKADGTGTLILPGVNGTFTNAIRVVTSQTINFSSSITTGTVTQINYDYYVTGIKAPAFSISTSTLASGITATSTQTLVFRNKNAVTTSTTTVGLKESKGMDGQTVLYPNPCNQSINFKLSSSHVNATLNVIDLTGKTIDLIEIDTDKLNLNTSNYNSGLYFYKLISTEGENLQTGKFTVSH